MSKKYRDLRELLNDVEKNFSDEVGFKFKRENNIVNIKYSKYIEDVRALAEYLLNRELVNNRIAFISPNRYEWAVTYMAVANSNLIAVPLDRSLPENEFRALLIRSEAEVLIYDNKYTEYIEKFKEDPEIKIKYYFNMNTDFEELIAKGKELIAKEDNKYSKVKIENDVMKFMLFTSGTTSAAKCVMLSHQNICANISAIQDTLDVTKEDTVLSFLPLHHTFECTAGFLYIISEGGKIAYCEGIRHFAENLKEFDVTAFINVPAMIEGLYKNVWKTIEKSKKEMQVKVALKASGALMKVGVDVRGNLFKQIHAALGGKIRFVVSGAAALSPSVSKTLNDMGIVVYQGYGLTETSPVISVEKKGATRNASVGKPLPGVEVKIKDPNEEGIGEIVVKGPSVMLGYYHDDENTKAVLKDGWFSTGDLGKIDKDGYIFITGRKKDVIVLKNGKNVFPDELESLINHLDCVSESIVFGSMAEDEDIILNAKIVYNKVEVAEKFGEITEKDLREYYWEKVKTVVNKKMPTYKYIKNIMITDEPLIKTTTNKVKRHEELKKILNKS